MPKISVVLPCRNEEDSIKECIGKIKSTLKGKNYEIIVSNNASTDNSAKIARALGAKVIDEPRIGYGYASLSGLKAASGDYLILGDADSSYDFSQIPLLIGKLEEGYDFVLGSRFRGKIKRGAMPTRNKIGNHVLSMMLKTFFKVDISDAHSGLRAIKKSAFEQLRLNTAGMEFASEMIIKAIKKNLKIGEVPITYNPRQGKSKLRPLRDTLRHLRFIFLYSPFYLFFVPGSVLFMLGFLIMVLLSLGPLSIGNLSFFVHPMFLGSLFSILGYQIITLGLFSKVYAVTHLGDRNRFIERVIRSISLEKALLLSILIFIVGAVIGIDILIKWIASSFRSLDAIKPAILSLTLIIIALQTAFSAFFLSIIGIEEKRQ